MNSFFSASLIILILTSPKNVAKNVNEHLFNLIQNLAPLSVNRFDTTVDQNRIESNRIWAWHWRCFAHQRSCKHYYSISIHRSPSRSRRFSFKIPVLLSNIFFCSIYKLHCSDGRWMSWLRRRRWLMSFLWKLNFIKSRVFFSSVFPPKVGFCTP